MGLLGNMGAKLIKKAMDARKDTSKPGHTHSSSSKNQNAGAAPAPVEKPQTYEPRSDGSGQQQPSFMGKNQVDGFKTLNDPLSVDRGGRTVPKQDELDNVGIEPAMNPPMAVPTPPSIDDEGVNSLYS